MSGRFAERRVAIALMVVGGLIPPVLHYSLGSATIASAGDRTMNLAEQVIAVVAAFGIKPLYMLLSVVAIWLLRRVTSADAIALRWSVVLFLAGEIACAANYLGFSESSYLLEYLHSFGMVLAFAFAAWATMEFIDARLMRFADPDAGCHAAAICQGCTKRGAGHPCAFATTMRFVLPALMVLGAIPLTAAPRPIAYTTTILGSGYLYMHDLPHQFYEIRLLPLGAVALLVASWVGLRQGHPFVLTRLLLAAGIGAIGFSWFRWVLFAAFSDNQLWFVVWEELTELLFVSAILYLLLAFGQHETVQHNDQPR